jgi:hypothetical protein
MSKTSDATHPLRLRFRTLVALLLLPAVASAREAGITVNTPMAPPAWALLQRELLRSSSLACEEFFARYFDERGYLLCVERWGGDDGPDDAIENVNDWPLLHALGAPDVVLAMYKKAWEGHLRQYTAAKTVEVPFARDGMYYKEFHVMFDWLHIGEGLTAFNLQGLSDPADGEFQKRVRRFAGFYLNEDPQAPNYDPEHKIIRSYFNGSRGPLLRRATAVDWAGDPIEVEGRFHLLHGERSYQEMLDHFKDYNDIIGDTPMNLGATTLALNAYMLAGERKYRDWLLEYVDAWRERMDANGGIIPSNIGLDGKIGGACGGKWYGGVYGWGFSVVVPQTGELAHRNQHQLGLTGFGNALLLTGDQRYVDAWRRMIDAVNANVKVIGGRPMVPTMHGDEGWYAYRPEKYSHGALEVYYWSMRPEDRERLPRRGWIAFLEGEEPGYPVAALERDLAQVRERVQGMRDDPTTPDTRLSDNPMGFNPAMTRALVELMLGGFHPGRRGAPLHARLRYFDPEARRAGVPPDVAALVDRLGDEEAAVTLVNVNQVHGRTLVVQAGAYAEHRFLEARVGGERHYLDSPYLKVRLEPGCGARLELRMKRYAHPPTLRFPF